MLNCTKLRVNLMMNYLTIRRSLTVQTALRPFFFKVHPDLFEKWPEERTINENSLQALSEHIESLEKGYQPRSKSSLVFYLRNKDKKSQPFKQVQVPLNNQKDSKTFVLNILKICDLPKEDIEKIEKESINYKKPKSTQSTSSTSQRVHDNDDEFSEEFDLFQFKVRKAREDETLSKFIKKNIDIAEIRTKNLDDLKEEVHKLKLELEKKLQLEEICYKCGWNIEHFRGCLKQLEKIHELYSNDMEHLKNKRIIFSQFTGVSLDGEIHLFTGDVRNNWLDLIKNIPKQEKYLASIPMYENTLSQVLRNIKLARRKFMPKTLAMNYSSHLSKAITNILDFLGKNKFPESWPLSLENFELVVENESGPLMLSPTGQLIMPSSCPAKILVDFITKNLDEAVILKTAYNKNKYIEKDLHRSCIVKLEANTILKDDNITPELMIDCMSRLLQSNIKFKQLNLHITSYYSILSDGTICIPWNFKE